jgi:hypothetical protein
MDSSSWSSLTSDERLLTIQTRYWRAPSLALSARARKGGHPFRDSRQQHDEHVQLVRGILRLVGVIDPAFSLLRLHFQVAIQGRHCIEQPQLIYFVRLSFRMSKRRIAIWA